MAGLLNRKQRGFRCELSYRIATAWEESCDGLTIGSALCDRSAPGCRVYLIGALPLDNTMRPQIGDQCANCVQVMSLAQHCALHVTKT